ncbi:XRE family transcriptional regulator [Streptomyces sp. NPDC059165]|uniref:XRE family transcriptional regulator n=1 Tax=Streptomyces sp. NPDC059165 TaxID=3346751 RepID=UPI003688843D
MADETTPPTDSTRERTDLADLVRARMEELGIALRPLAAASIDPENPDAGPLWTHPTLANLINGARVKPPRLPELRALAAGLRLPLRDLQDAAAAEYFGIVAVYTDDRQARVLLRHFDQLSDADRAKIVKIAEDFRRRTQTD